MAGDFFHTADGQDRTFRWIDDRAEFIDAEHAVDPVYTGKAMAGLIGLVREGFFRAHENVIFLHTGGVAALFAYGDLLADL